MIDSLMFKSQTANAISRVDFNHRLDKLRIPLKECKS